MTSASSARGSRTTEGMAVAQPLHRKQSRRPAFDHVSVTVTPIAAESPRMKAILELLFPTDETVRGA